MKQILKKISAVCTAFLCAAAVTMAGAGVVRAESEIDENVKQQITMTAEGLTEAIIPLSEDEIGNYMESGDDFTKQAMTSWNDTKEELGGKKEEQKGDIKITYANSQYTASLPVQFEKADANFVYLFDENVTPTSMTVEVQYPMSVTLERAGLNTVMGLATVFLMLIFLCFVIYLFRFIPGLLEGRKNKAEAVAEPSLPQQEAVRAVPAAEPAAADDIELIAVITAAIAASEGTGTDGFVVRSIRKVNHKKW